MQELINKGEINEKKDIVFYTEFFIYRKLPGGFIIILKKGSRKHKDSLEKILELRKLFYQKSLLVQMLRLPNETKVEFDDSGMLKPILPQSKTPELFNEQIDSVSRFIETNAFVPDWNSNFREECLKTLKTPLIKGRDNIARLKKEDKENFKSYSSMKDYFKAFKQLYGIDFNIFFQIISKIIYLSYNNLHTIGVWNHYEILREIRAKTKFHPEDIRNVIKLLLESTELNRYRCIILGNKILTNFHRLNVARFVLSENCFKEAYSKDLKGRNFEEACRKLLRDKGLVTFQERVDIFESMLPTNISDRLWGYQKNRSDIDVVSCSDNRIIVIECKEIKSAKLKTRKIKIFNKYAIEHFYKTKWIAENISKFENYLGKSISDALSVDKNRIIYIFPLLVTNKPVDIAKKQTSPITSPLITYLELKEISFSKDLQIDILERSSGFIEIQILSRNIVLPWFSVIP